MNNSGFPLWDMTVIDAIERHRTSRSERSLNHVVLMAKPLETRLAISVFPKEQFQGPWAANTTAGTVHFVPSLAVPNGEIRLYESGECVATITGFSTTVSDYPMM